MNKFYTSLFLVLCFSISLFSQKNNQEFRSTWVITWEYISSSGSVQEKKDKIIRILDQHKEANMTSVLWQVRQAGTAYYNSSFEPWGSYAGGIYPGFDPLAFAIEEAHKRGLEIHAWFNVFASGSTVKGAPAAEHPEWICRDMDGNPMTASIALSPGLPAVRQYLLNVAMEVVRNYDIDGFHLDYVRWNEYSNSGASQRLASRPEEQNKLDGTITEEQIVDLALNAAGRYLYDVEHPYSAGVPAGYAAWPEFWRASVTAYVQALHDSIQSVKPWVRLSAAALGKYNWSGWNGYSVVYQDAALWFNEGYIDQLTPMHYHWTTGSGFKTMLTSNNEGWGPHIQKGIAAGRLFSTGPGSYILQDNNVWNNHKDVVETVRTVEWNDGFQFFSYGNWRDHEYFDDAAALFFKNKTKIRSNKLISTEVPGNPTAAIAKVDSFNYQITITPPAVSENHWYILYRSEDSNVDPSQDEIVEVFFGGASPIVYNDKFNGLQDFEGIYTYAATALNRYWNESPVSNTVQTSHITSVPPAVVSTVPQEGAEAEVTGSVTINFNKSMDAASLTSAVTITPQEPFTLHLSNDNKSVQLTFDGFLKFSTDYTVTINTTAADVNGKPLAVNGNSFKLNFKTVGKDSLPPAVVSVHPGDVLLDQWDVINIAFNELIDSAGVDTSGIKLRKGTEVINAEFHVRSNGKNSFINLRPAAGFQSSAQYELSVGGNISDIFGNKIGGFNNYALTVSPLSYTENKKVDDFSTNGDWRAPGFSGSTTGILPAESAWDWTNVNYLPGTTPRRAGMLVYKWDPDQTSRLIREYLAGGTPRDVTFDSSYILQVYIYGDGSGNRFRFAIDESVGSAWPNHEVSQWITIDWYGWRLIEWDLGDPETVGEWIGNGALDGDLFRMDSFQLTDAPGAAQGGTLYFDNLRAVKKDIVSGIADNYTSPAENGYNLYQNYPNPFNPVTMIPFNIKETTEVSLEVYDILGSKIKTLLQKEMQPGYYQIPFDGTGLASGKYIYRLRFGTGEYSKIMMLLK